MNEILLVTFNVKKAEWPYSGRIFGITAVVHCTICNVLHTTGFTELNLKGKNYWSFGDSEMHSYACGLFVGISPFSWQTRIFFHLQDFDLILWYIGHLSLEQITFRLAVFYPLKHTFHQAQSGSITTVTKKSVPLSCSLVASFFPSSAASHTSPSLVASFLPSSAASHTSYSPAPLRATPVPPQLRSRLLLQVCTIYTDILHVLFSVFKYFWLKCY